MSLGMTGVAPLLLMLLRSLVLLRCLMLLLRRRLTLGRGLWLMGRSLVLRPRRVAALLHLLPVRSRSAALRTIDLWRGSCCRRTVRRTLCPRLSELASRSIIVVLLHLWTSL